jgi:hypothetical protein
MDNYKLGFGPMSPEIIELLCEYNKPLMIIASRNQIDADSGYVMTTRELANKLSSLDTSNIKLCRDHCGPYFLDSEKSLSINDAIKATKKTINNDIENGFDLIHIDTSRCENPFTVAEELIRFCLDLKPTIRFEFGTEENIGIAASVEKYKQDVSFAKQFPNMDFVVAQTGSLVYEDRQAGDFRADITKELVSIANENSVSLKEHNADYLDSSSINLRKQCGVHALNIAPQLGVVQTKLLRSLSQAIAKQEWNNFSESVISSNKWKKWSDGNSHDLMVSVAGHYCFNSNEYRNLISRVSSRFDWKEELRKELFFVLDTYFNNID